MNTSPQGDRITLPINNREQRFNIKYNSTICAHGELRYNHSNKNILGEWFEAYLMLGGNKVILYNLLRTHTTPNHAKHSCKFTVS